MERLLKKPDYKTELLDIIHEIEQDRSLHGKCLLQGPRREAERKIH